MDKEHNDELEGMHIDTELLDKHDDDNVDGGDEDAMEVVPSQNALPAIPTADVRASARAKSATPGVSDLDDDKITEEERKRLLRKQEQDRRKQIRAVQKQKIKELREEQNKAVKEKGADSGARRLKYLLEETDIVTHFMSGTGMSKKADDSSRKSEEEEDAELLKEDVDIVKGSAANTRLLVQPNCVPTSTGVMRSYQVAGLNWLIRLYENGISGILADEMGLGKTLQTISLLGFLKESKGVDGPHLVIVPKSTLGNWMREFARWCPLLRVFKFHGDQDERAEMKSEKLQPGRFDCCVTSYEVAIRERAALRKFNWTYLIIDEAHRIKNEQSTLSECVRDFSSENRLLLTGTPLQNNLHELWALLNFLLPDTFGSSEDFDSWFQIKGDDGAVQQDIVSQLHKVLRPFLLRRLKKDVEKELPPKIETKVFVGMSAMQHQWYKKLLMRDIEFINQANSREKTRLLNIVMQLRKCCNHPYLFDGAEPGPPYTTDMHLIENSGKMVVLDRLLTRLKERGNRVLIFSQMTRVLDILEDYMTFRQYNYCRIDGNTEGVLRESQIDEFNAPDSPKFVFLLSTRAGGLGINLATADTVILFDSDWNPQVDLQAMDRAHRIGQVHVYRLVTENSVEEKVVERAEYKLQLDALVIQQGRLMDKQQNASAQELSAMLKYGADQIFKSQGSTITDEDIDIILARGEEKTKMINDKLQKAVNTNLDHFSLGDDGTKMYQFDGVDYSRSENRSKNTILDSWLELPSRERKQTYNVNAYYRQALQMSDVRRGPKPGMPRGPRVYDFQFYNPRLYELVERERKVALKNATAAQPVDRLTPGMTPGMTPVASVPNLAEKDKEYHESESESEAKELTEEEKVERDELLEDQDAFANWSKADFQQYLRALEAYGRHDIDNISKMMEGLKTKPEIVDYQKVFFERGPKELSEWPKYIKMVERGESKLERMTEISRILSRALNDPLDPCAQITLDYNTAGIKSRIFTEEEDRYLVIATARAGYGNWEEVKKMIKQAWQFQFDWYLRSRTPAEIQRRVDNLLKALEKKQQEEDAVVQQVEAEKRKKELLDKRKNIETSKKDKGKKREELERESAEAKERIKKRKADLAKLERELDIKVPAKPNKKDDVSKTRSGEVKHK